MSTLDRLAPGDRGVITEILGVDAVSARLMEMGLLPGERVEVIGVAPFGDPVAIRVRGTRLAIRRGDASRIQLHAAMAEAVLTAGAPVAVQS